MKQQQDLLLEQHRHYAHGRTERQRSDPSPCSFLAGMRGCTKGIPARRARHRAPQEDGQLARAGKFREELEVSLQNRAWDRSDMASTVFMGRARRDNHPTDSPARPDHRSVSRRGTEPTQHQHQENPKKKHGTRVGYVNRTP